MTREARLFAHGPVCGDLDSASAALRSVRARGDTYLELLCCLYLVEIGDDSDRWLAEATGLAQSLGIGRATRRAPSAA
ncbi:hypothetical protein OG901_53165 [Streptomyces mirabilis]|uniref:hypothetical protein n=1 Tax=Streptomyces mirabilis TaxID=68239 RepID=UPI00224C8F73|nr:hypothetical protein [Streptomyces mirabilis]MCX5356218.1 hypothetical protein [Streptomyces mirabilis]